MLVLALPADIEDIFQTDRKLKKASNGHKPPRGVIITEAVRGIYGNHPAAPRKAHRHAP